jgi:stage V sporulation protein AD
MNTRKQTIKFNTPVKIISTSSIVGPKEGKGPLANTFDVILDDSMYGESSWEKSESKIVKESFRKVIDKANFSSTDIDYLISGDLLNQNFSSNFAARELNIPFIGVFGACSTFGEAMGVGALLIEGKHANNVLVGASSHFCAAEKQFRFPLELGTQRTPTATWTVTGQGSALLSNQNKNKYNVPRVTAFTIGKVIDMGITDINNMGAAMAPAAFDVINAHIKDLSVSINYYDLIVTGDLGYVGTEILKKVFLQEKNINLNNHSDCGVMIFDRDKQKTDSGGSGCGCSAVTFAGYLYQQLLDQKINKLLFVPTGALVNQTSAQQGESIPGIAYAVAIENI